LEHLLSGPGRRLHEGFAVSFVFELGSCRGQTNRRRGKNSTWRIRTST